MKPPAPVNYVVGNALVLTIFSGLMLYFVWQASQGLAEWIAPLMFLGFASVSYSARERILAYREWKARWDGYDGVPKTRIPLKLKAIGMLSFVGFFLFVAWFDRLTPSGRGTAMSGGALLLAIGLVVWVLIKLKQAFGIRRSSPSNPGREPVVLICLPKPSPDRTVVERAYLALPPHCQAILRRR